MTYERRAWLHVWGRGVLGIDTKLAADVASRDDSRSPREETAYSPIRDNPGAYREPEPEKPPRAWEELLGLWFCCIVYACFFGVYSYSLVQGQQV